MLVKGLWLGEMCFGMWSGMLRTLVGNVMYITSSRL